MPRAPSPRARPPCDGPWTARQRHAVPDEPDHQRRRHRVRGRHRTFLAARTATLPTTCRPAAMAGRSRQPASSSSSGLHSISACSPTPPMRERHRKQPGPWAGCADCAAHDNPERGRPDRRERYDLLWLPQLPARWPDGTAVPPGGRRRIRADRVPRPAGPGRVGHDGAAALSSVRGDRHRLRTGNRPRLRVGIGLAALAAIRGTRSRMRLPDARARTRRRAAPSPATVRSARRCPGARPRTPPRLPTSL